MITFSITPIGKPRMVHSDKWAKRETVLRYYAFKDELTYLAKAKKYEVPSELIIIFYIPMPNSWSQKKYAQFVGQPHQSKPDIDNLVKAFLDCLCEDDSFVYKITATKYWGLEGAIMLPEPADAFLIE